MSSRLGCLSIVHYSRNVWVISIIFYRTLPMEDWPLVQLMEGDSGGVVLRNLNVYEVTTEEEALQLFFMVGYRIHTHIYTLLSL